MGIDKEFLTKEKLLGIHRHKYFKWAVLILAAILFLDILFLNYRVLSFESPREQEQTQNIQTEKLQEETESQESSIVKQEDVCDAACIARFNQEIAALKSLQAQKTTVSAPSSTTSVKEFYVPFGSGVNSSDEWQDVPGLQVYINRNSYPSIKTVTFEASIRVPTGNQTADVRLFNVTAGHPVWFSEMTFTGGGTPQLLISQPITLDPGSNLYKVQMKTQLKFPAYLDQARVHIATF